MTAIVLILVLVCIYFACRPRQNGEIRIAVRFAVENETPLRIVK